MTTTIQFYLKCQNIDTGEVVTYRFAHQDELLAFSTTLADKKLAIVDTHIAFYDIDLLFNPFDGESLPINSGEINTAIDGKI
ncbi:MULTISPECIES: hypothetical protein [unclassified Moraxella]|uniref:hypothetical protein n=1 Tax=unclassified Moraxella TaxID=2685852 RepID=UPI003AF75BBB